MFGRVRKYIHTVTAQPHSSTAESLLKTWLILNNIFDLESWICLRLICFNSLALFISFFMVFPHILLEAAGHDNLLKSLHQEHFYYSGLQSSLKVDLKFRKVNSTEERTPKASRPLLIWREVHEKISNTSAWTRYLLKMLSYTRLIFFSKGKYGRGLFFHHHSSFPAQNINTYRLKF